MHASSAASSRFRLEGFGNIFPQRFGTDQCHFPIRFFHHHTDEAFYLMVRDAIGEDLLVLCDLLDRILNRALGLIQEREGKEQTRGGVVADVVCDRLQHSVFL